MTAKLPSRAPICIGRKKRRLPISEEETENDEAVDEIGARNAEGEEDEVKFKRVEQAPQVFGGQRTPKLARMFVEKTDVGVDGVEGGCVAFVEAARGTAQQRHEKEQAKQAGDDAVLVTVGKKTAATTNTVRKMAKSVQSQAVITSNAR